MKSLLLAGFCVCLFVSAQAQTKSNTKTDSAQIRLVILNFYKWYTTHWTQVTSFKLYKSKKGNDQPPYEIDWPQVDQYLNYLRTNAPMLGEGFMQAEKKRFQSIAKRFVKDKDSEVPPGFDYDHFTNTQEEPKLFLDELTKSDKKWRVTFQSNIKAHMISMYKEGDLFFCSDLIKEKGVWKIINLECESN